MTSSKFGLTKNLTMHYSLTNSELMNFLNNRIDKKSTSHNLFSGDKNYAGTITSNKIEINYKRSIFSGLLSYPNISGKIICDEKDNSLSIEYCVKGLVTEFKVLLILLFIAIIPQFFIIPDKSAIILPIFIIALLTVYSLTLLATNLVLNRIKEDFKHD